MFAPAPEIRILFPMHLHPAKEEASMMPMIARRKISNDSAARGQERMKITATLHRQGRVCRWPQIVRENRLPGWCANAQAFFVLLDLQSGFRRRATCQKHDGERHRDES